MSEGMVDIVGCLECVLLLVSSFSQIPRSYVHVQLQRGASRNKRVSRPGPKIYVRHQYRVRLWVSLRRCKRDWGLTLFDDSSRGQQGDCDTLPECKEKDPLDT